VFYKLGLEGKTNPELEVEIIAQGKTLVRGNFRGPRVRVMDPVIDFGLVKVNT